MDRKRKKDSIKSKKSCKTKKIFEPEKKPEALNPEPQVFPEQDEEDNEEEIILSVASVTTYAESIGIESLSEEIATSLAEDTTYRLREVIHNCAVLLKNNKRNKLTVNDLNNVLEAYEAPTLYGYESFPEIKWTYLKPLDIFVPQTETIDLVSAAKSNKQYFQNKDPTVKVSWITPELSEMISEVDMNSDCEETNDNSPPLTSDIGHGFFVLKNEDKVLPKNDLRFPPHVQKYCIHLAKIIIGGYEPYLKIVLKDVRTNPRVSAVSPYLLNFVTLAINMLDRRATLTYALLRVVEALVQNRYVNPSYSHSVKRAVNALLVIAIEPNKMADCDDLLLRKRASLLLKNVLQSWIVEHKQQNDIIKILEGVLYPNISLASHYGALILLTVLGYCAKIYFFYAILKRYIPILSDIELKNVSNRAADINSIKGALLLAAESMYRHDLRSNRTLEEWKYWQKIDEILFSYFGDTLCLRRLCSPLVNNTRSSTFPSTNHQFDGEDILLKEKKSEPPGHFNFFTNAVSRSCKVLAKKYKPVSSFQKKNQRSKSNFYSPPALVFECYRFLDSGSSRFCFNFFGSSQIPYEKLKRKKLSILYPPFDPVKYKLSQCEVGKETRKIKFCTSLYKKSCVGDLYICI